MLGGLKSERKNASHDLLNAIPFETASTSLLLHLACRSVARPSTVTVAGGGGELNVLLVESHVAVCRLRRRTVPGLTLV